MSECPLRNDNSPVSKCSKLLLHCSLKLRFTSPGLSHQGFGVCSNLGIAPARPCPTPRLASSFRADSIPSIPRCFCPATPCGRNDSVYTQCLGVAFGGVEQAPLLGCFLTPECFDIVRCSPRPYPRLAIMQRVRCSSVQLATLLRCLSERGCQRAVELVWRRVFRLIALPELLLRSVVCNPVTLSGSPRTCSASRSQQRLSMRVAVCAQETAQRSVFKLEPALT